MLGSTRSSESPIIRVGRCGNTDHVFFDPLGPLPGCTVLKGGSVLTGLSPSPVGRANSGKSSEEDEAVVCCPSSNREESNRSRMPEWGFLRLGVMLKIESNKRESVGEGLLLFAVRLRGVLGFGVIGNTGETAEGGKRSIEPSVSNWVTTAFDSIIRGGSIWNGPGLPSALRVSKVDP